MIIKAVLKLTNPFEVLRYSLFCTGRQTFPDSELFESFESSRLSVKLVLRSFTGATCVKSGFIIKRHLTALKFPVTQSVKNICQAKNAKEFF